MSRVFLDENVDARLASLLPDHYVRDFVGLGLNGLSNGALLRQIEPDYDVIITHNRNMEFQHNWKVRSISLIVLQTRGNTVKNYAAVIDRIEGAIAEAKPGQILQILED